VSTDANTDANTESNIANATFLWLADQRNLLGR
jgi:hypothetical protein